MKYFLVLLILIGLTVIVSANVYAMPPVDSQTIYDFSDVILLGKVISVNSTFSPTHNLYEIKVEKFLKNQQNLDIVFAAGQNTINTRLGNQIFNVNDRVLFFLNNDTIGYDRYSGIFGIFPESQLVKPEWDKCNIFEKEIPSEHWFLGGTRTAPKIQQGINSDIENFKTDKLITITYDVSNLSYSTQEFDLDGTVLVSNGTAFEVRAISNQHIILEPCTAYKTIDWRIIPGMSGFYNFEIKDSRSGNYGLGFTVIDNGSTVRESPLKQLKSGIEPKDIVCKIGLELVIKKSNGEPVCIKGTSVKSLTLRGYIPEYNGALGGEITSDELVIGIPHALPVEPKQSQDELTTITESFNKKYGLDTEIPEIWDDSWSVGNWTTFDYEIESENVTYGSQYEITGGTVDEIRYDKHSNSLIISLNESEKGHIKIVIQTGLLYSFDKMPSTNYFVVADGKEVIFEQLSPILLKIPFEKDTKRIEIIGADAYEN